ncbi:MAG: hypothetical protein J4G05_01040 [Chlorobi bacterium]|nr:hypothetical protein [Chlorobiota bacterium]
MRVTIFKILSICFLAPLFTLCSNGEQSGDRKLSGKYVDKSESLILDLKQVGDSLLGMHCFVVQDGNKVDCCLEEDGISLKLSRTFKDTFKGTLSSCYDQDVREVKAVFADDYLKLSFKGKPHLFVPEKLDFYLIKSD